MKRTHCIIALVALMAVLFAACGGTPAPASSGSSASAGQATSTDGRRVSSRVPDFVRRAVVNAPEDALIGIGSAKMSTDAQSRTFATTRARAEIARQMSTMIQDMIRDYTATSEADPSAVLSFQENITTALSKAELIGSKEIGFGYEDGVVWIVMQLGKTNAAEIINQQQAAAKLAVPAMASFNAEDRMNDAFAKAYGSEVSYSDRD